MFRWLGDRMIKGWTWFKHEERGAQTLEWLALALLILGILGVASTGFKDGKFAEALKNKFVNMIENFDKPSNTGTN